LFSLKTSLWISVAFILVTATKNSIEIAEKKEFKVYQALFVSLSLIVFHFMSVQTTASPFLYFNF